MRGISRNLCVVAMLAASAAADAQHFCDGPPEQNLLTGESVILSARLSEGHPSGVAWWITPPGEEPAEKPTSTEWNVFFSPGEPGLWSIALEARYPHEAGVGELWSHETCITVQVSSVVATVRVDPDQVTTEESLEITGFESTWAPGVTPQAEWQVDGLPFGACNPAPPPTSPADLSCTIPGDWLTAGWHTAGLLLTDPISGQTSLATADFEVTEIIPLSVDFSWHPSEPDPGTWVQFTADVVPVTPETDLVRVSWDFGDGYTHESSPCPPFIGSCYQWQNNYEAEGWYDVTVIVETEEETATMTHEVKIGDPVPRPVASFTVAPTAPLLHQVTALSFDGSCTGICQWSWDFGDGVQSSLESPNHAWTVPGTHQVELTVTNQSASDLATVPVDVTNCWQPSSPAQTGSCYGGPVILRADAGAAWFWSTGATTRWIASPLEGEYWANIDSGGGCWGHSTATVVLTNCGSPDGDANLDGATDAADLSALIPELTDGDGDTVVLAGGGDLTAPGGDATGDARLRADDTLTVLLRLFQ